MAKKPEPKQEAIKQEDAEVAPKKPRSIITSATESSVSSTRVKTTRELYMEPSE